ncbi:cdc14ab [Symbiodinium sp. KB8]|nr:cdc14ab [Symbiodinium sp. KB8]
MTVCPSTFAVVPSQTTWCEEERNEKAEKPCARAGDVPDLGFELCAIAPARSPAGPATKEKEVHYFSVDQEFIYEPFFADFGPLNLGMVWRYCKTLEAKLADASLAEKRIVHYCSHDPKKRANAATLISAFQVIVLGKPADEDQLRNAP